MNFIGLGNGPDDFSNMVSQLFCKSVAGFDALFHGNEGDDALALDFMGSADDCGLGDGFVSDEGAFDLGCAKTVAGDVENIVEAADDPEVSFLVASGTIASGVDAGVITKVGFLKSAFVAVDGP